MMTPTQHTPPHATPAAAPPDSSHSPAAAALCALPTRARWHSVAHPISSRRKSLPAPAEVVHPFRWSRGPTRIGASPPQRAYDVGAGPPAGAEVIHPTAAAPAFRQHSSQPPPPSSLPAPRGHRPPFRYCSCLPLAARPALLPVGVVAAVLLWATTSPLCLCSSRHRSRGSHLQLQKFYRRVHMMERIV